MNYLHLVFENQFTNSNEVLILLILILIRLLFSIYANFKIQKTIFDIRTNLSSALFKISLSNTFFKINSILPEDWKKVIYNECNQIVAFIKPIITIIFDSIVLIFLLINSVYLLSFTVSIGLLLSFSGILIFTYFSLRTIDRFGYQRQKFDGERLSICTKACDNNNNIIIEKLSALFYQKFIKSSNLCTKSLALYNTLMESFPIFIEASFIFVLLTIIMFGDIDNASYAPLGYAALKCLPIFKRIISSIQRVKYGTVALKTIISVLSKGDFSKFSNSHLLVKSNDSIKINSFSVCFQKDTETNFKSIILPEKGLVSIIGNNGIGKSSWLKIISGNTHYTVSSDKHNCNVQDSLSTILLPQNHTLLLDDVKDITNHYNISFEKFCGYLMNLNDNIVKSTIKNNSSSMCSYIESNLSGGQIQRLLISLFLSKDSNIFLLDEPTSEQDNDTKYIINLLQKKSRNKLIIVTTHDKNLIQSSDFVYEYTRVDNCVIFKTNNRL